VTISPANAKPTVTASVSTPNSSTGVVTGTVTATDADTDTLTYSGPASTAKGAVTVTSAGALTYTPTAAAMHAASASAAGKQDTFSVTVNDGHGGVVTVPVTVTIIPTNAQPTIAKVSVDKPNSSTGKVTGTVTATDADKDKLTYKAPTKTSKGAVSITSTGAFTYTPTAAARQKAGASNAAAAAKQDTFTVTVTDGHGGSASVAVKVTVLGTAAFSNQLNSGQTLKAGGKLVSSNGTYRLTMQSDGNLVLYKKNTAKAQWSTKTAGETGARAVMQSDGNLVVYKGAKAVWDSSTNGQKGASLVLRNDGNLVVKKNSTTVWVNPRDDYPSDLKDAKLDAKIDTWRFYNRECTSFVAWRLTNLNGATNFTNFMKGPNGKVGHFGNANEWVANAKTIGYTVNDTPKVGAVAVEKNVGGLGHIAWVSAVNGSQVQIEEYNKWNGKVFDGAYHKRTAAKSAFTYIHIKDL